ncbi:FIST C-terminal domain-containing protein [bacterium]|nr:FIST C-terminal domain-containing protein [bacterium]
MRNSDKIIAIGSSRQPDSKKAAQEATESILEQFGPEISVGWALIFCGGRHDSQTVIQHIGSRLNTDCLIGGAAVGTITRDLLGTSGYELSIAAFSEAIPKPVLISVEDLDKGEIEAGEKLGARLREIAHEGDTVLLFYDSIQSSPPPVLHVGSYLMEGIYRGLQGKSMKLLGAGTAGDLQLSGSHIFSGNQMKKHAAAAMVLPSSIESHTRIMHGCVPVSSFMEITKIEGAVLYELDGRPALEILMEMLGEDRGPSVTDNLSLSLTIGQKHGDPFAPYDESSYVNRLILASNPENGSVVLFEADFQEGTRIQIMSRDNHLMYESVQKGTQELLESVQNRDPFFALYIDCAGRCNAFSGSEVEEASIVQNRIGQNVPLLGFYSGVEIAPLLGRSRPLDWTGVLTLFFQNRESS